VSPTQVRRGAYAPDTQAVDPTIRGDKPCTELAATL